MTRLLHTGDTHVGYQQYHVPERRADFLAAFRAVAEDAIEEEVDAVVHAGDLFHDRRPTLPDLLGVIDVLEGLAAAEVPFLAIVGNHEAKRNAQWLDLFETLGLATRLGAEPVVVGEVALYGLDFVPRAKREAFEPDFTPHDADHAALVAHGLFEPFDHGEWDPEAILDPAAVAFDAMLLGDNHDPGMARVDGTWVTYCGSTERASADEREPRGYNLVTVDGDVDIARRGLATREFVFVELDLAASEGVDRVRERVAQHDLEDAVVVVDIDGEGEPIAPAPIEEFVREQGALVARVTDRRERDADAEVEVSFADPDEAVRERVRELGLSEAARDLDETIRASKVSDSRVADEVESRVRDLLEADASTFEPVGAPGGTAGDSTEEAASARGATEPASTDTDGAGGETVAGATEADSDGSQEDARVAADDHSAGSREEGSSGAGGADSAESSGESAAGTEHPPEDPDDQATMEEYR